MFVNIRPERAEPRLPYFTDFPWVMIALIADVHHTARVRRS